MAAASWSQYGAGSSPPARGTAATVSLFQTAGDMHLTRSLRTFAFQTRSVSKHIHRWRTSLTRMWSSIAVGELCLAPVLLCEKKWEFWSIRASHPWMLNAFGYIPSFPLQNAFTFFNQYISYPLLFLWLFFSFLFFCDRTFLLSSHHNKTRATPECTEKAIGAKAQ
jgi:hypothetical protein